MFNPVEGKMQVGQELRHSLYRSASLIGQSTLGVFCLGFGCSVLNEVEMCHFVISEALPKL